MGCLADGAGKTTTIPMPSCLISPDEGDAWVCGYSVLENQLKVRDVIGILTENPRLYGRLVVYGNLDFFAEVYGVAEKNERVNELLGFFELWERRGNKVASLFKGMRQNLGVAGALLHNPPILFLDEPTSGLAPQAAKEFGDLMVRLSGVEKRTIILSAHRLEGADKLCSGVMHKCGCEVEPEGFTHLTTCEAV